MKNYKVVLRFISAVQTPLEADTIFGHICWSIRYLYGEKKLLDFLNMYDESPPLVISNGFYNNKIPFPMFSPLKNEEAETIRKKLNLSESEFYKLQKRLKKLKYVDLDFLKSKSFIINRHNFYLNIFEMLKDKVDNSSEEINIEIWHNSINRLTNLVDKGKLFSKQVKFYPPETEFDIYLKSSEFLTLDELKEIFNYISINGYGADKSTGYGQFKYSMEEFNGFPQPANFNAYILLSNTTADILKENYPINYEMTTKFGKVGGIYSTQGIYVKKPLVMLKEGTVIFSSEDKDYFGSITKNVYSLDENVIQYTIGYPLKVRLENEV